MYEIFDDLTQSPDGDISNSLIRLPGDINSDSPGDPLRSAPDSVSDGISESLGATIRVDVGTQLQVARTARNMFFRENPWWVKRLQHMSPQTSTESKMLKVKPIETAIQIDSRKGNISQKSSVVVEVRNLSKSYGHQLAVKDVSFSFRGGRSSWASGSQRRG